MAVQKNVFTYILFKYASLPWARNKKNLIETYLKKKHKLLDIGAGKGGVCYLLDKEGYTIKGIDVRNNNISPFSDIIHFDGKHIPFKDKEFDTSLLLTVLHHVKNQEELFNDVIRVSKNILILEDVYKNVFLKYMTFFMDSLMNLEFIGHPHSNKTRQEWITYFEKKGLKLISIKKQKVLLFFEQNLFVLSVP